MNKTSSIAAIMEHCHDCPIVFTTGYTSRIAHNTSDRPLNLYMTGSMGLASAIALGVALETGLPCVAVDGDGAFLMNPAGCLAVAASPTVPLLHVVLDDGIYASTGGQPVARKTDFVAIALAAGYVMARRAESHEQLCQAIQDWMRAPATALVHVVLGDPDGPVPPRVTAHLKDHGTRFRHAIERLAASPPSAASPSSRDLISADGAIHG